MMAPSPRASTRASFVHEALGFAGMAFILRFFLIALYPGLYGGDPIARMLHLDRLVLAYQLPVFQILIAAAYRVADHPLAARLASAGAGAFATFGVYLLIRSLAGRRLARLCAALFLTNPLNVVYSLMPYQEPLMIGFLGIAGAAYRWRRMALMSLALGLACLTRYESWIAAAALFAIELHRERGRSRSFSPPAAVRAAVVFGWAPLAWMLWNSGVAPAGTYVADPGWSAARWTRIPYLAERIGVHAPYALVLAPLGLAHVLRGKRKRLLALLLVVAVVTAAIVAFGHDYPPDTASVSERAAHLPLLGALVLSAAGLHLLGRRRPGRAVGAATACALLLSVGLSFRQVRARAEEPEVAAIHHLAEYLERELPPGERALVVAPPMDPLLADHYLGLIEARKPGELAAARRLVEELSLPERFQRLVVSLARGRERLIEAGRWNGEPIARAVVFQEAFDRIPRGIRLRQPPQAAFFEGEPAWVYAVEESR